MQKHRKTLKRLFLGWYVAFSDRLMDSLQLNAPKIIFFLIWLIFISANRCVTVLFICKVEVMRIKNILGWKIVIEVNRSKIAWLINRKMLYVQLSCASYLVEILIWMTLITAYIVALPCSARPSFFSIHRKRRNWVICKEK